MLSELSIQLMNYRNLHICAIKNKIAASLRGLLAFNSIQKWGEIVRISNYIVNLFLRVPAEDQQKECVI